MKVKTPSVKEGSKKRGKVKRRSRHRKLLREILKDLREVRQALKWEE